LTIRQAEF